MTTRRRLRRESLLRRQARSREKQRRRRQSAPEELVCPCPPSPQEQVQQQAPASVWELAPEPTPHEKISNFRTVILRIIANAHVFWEMYILVHLKIHIAFTKFVECAYRTSILTLGRLLGYTVAPAEFQLAMKFMQHYARYFLAKLLQERKVSVRQSRKKILRRAFQ